MSQFVRLFIVLLCQIPLAGFAAQLVFDLNDLKIQDGFNDAFYYVDLNEFPSAEIDEFGRVMINFGEGRVAALAYTDSFAKDVKQPGKIAEITCLPNSYKTNCEAISDVYFRQYTLVWYNHPDYQKLGKPLQKVDDGNSRYDRVLELGNPMFSPDMEFARFKKTIMSNKPTEDLEFRLPRMKCDNFDWFDELAQSFGDHPNQITINEWTSELMRANTESFVSENRGMFSHLGVTLEKQSDDSLELKNIRFYGQAQGEDLPLYVGDVTGWNLSKGPEVCDLSFNFSYGTLIEELSKTQGQLRDPNTKFKIVENVTKTQLIDVSEEIIGRYADIYPLVKDHDQMFILMTTGLLRQNNEFIQVQRPTRPDGTIPAGVSVNQVKPLGVE